MPSEPIGPKPIPLSAVAGRRQRNRVDSIFAARELCEAALTAGGCADVAAAWSATIALAETRLADFMADLALESAGFMPPDIASHRQDIIDFLTRRGCTDAADIWSKAVTSLKSDLNQLLRRRALSLAGLSEPRRAQANSKTGYRGVSRKRSRFQARVCRKINGKKIETSLGCFNTPEQAAQAIADWHRDNP